MKLVCISDTHMSTPDLPEGDILIHAGDATFRGTIDEVSKFAEYIKTQKHKFDKIIFVPGNHDFLFETNESLARSILQDCTVLINESYEYKGIKFWGSPICPPFGNWAFYKEELDRVMLWNTIPDDTDILITHGPPKYMLDQVPTQIDDIIKHCGCEKLLEKVKDLQPKYHIFGHIHEGYGFTRYGSTTFLNACIMDEGYKPKNQPWCFNYRED